MRGRRAVSQIIGVPGVGHGALGRRATVKLIVAHEIVQVHQENRFGVQLLTAVRHLGVASAGRFSGVGRLLRVRPIFRPDSLVLCVRAGSI